MDDDDYEAHIETFLDAINALLSRIKERTEENEKIAEAALNDLKTETSA